MKEQIEIYVSIYFYYLINCYIFRKTIVIVKKHLSRIVFQGSIDNYMRVTEAIIDKKYLRAEKISLTPYVLMNEMLPLL